MTGRTYVMADLAIDGPIPRLEATADVWEELKRRFPARDEPGAFGPGPFGIDVFIVEDLPVPWRLVDRYGHVKEPGV